MTRIGARLAASASALTLVVAACGSSDVTGTASTTGATTAATTVTTGPNTTATAPPAVAAPSTDAPAARPTGSITIYTGRSEALVKPILDQFAAATGVKVELRTGDSGELGALLLTEGKGSPADLFFSQDAGALGAVTKAGLLATLPDDVARAVPAAYAASDRTWVGLSGRVRVVVYNPVQAASPPDTIDELLDPQWKGKIGFAPTNASWQSFVTALRVLRGEAGAKTWLTAFAAQQPKAYERNGAVRDAVNSGEVALGLVNHYYLYELIAAKGAAAAVAKNQFMAAGDPGGLVNVAGVGLLKSAKNPDAALALVRYLQSATGQKYFAEKTYEYPLSSGVAAVLDLPALSSLRPPAIDLADLDTLAATQELLASVGLLTK
jgi:iron(III) transport system substrate-binding protein